MPLTKVLQSIGSQIKELSQSLELFSDKTIQPGVEDCELLQKQMAELQESLAIYKFSLRDIDFSPSYKIHAMISEKDPGTTSGKEQLKTHSQENSAPVMNHT